MTLRAGELAPASLIVGCGFLGRVLATRLLQLGVTVYGTTTRESRARELAAIGIRPLLVDVLQPLTFAALKPAILEPSLDVHYMVPPGRSTADRSPQQVIRQGIPQLAIALKSASIRSAILVSSTAVYSESHGRSVSADTPAEPGDERGRLLLEAETLWLSRVANSRVLRLAGLYGPGRVIGRDALLEGLPLAGDPQQLLNLIHVDDAADLLLHMSTSPTAGLIELGCDGSPLPRMEYYRTLARLLEVPPPVAMSNEEAQAMGVNVLQLRRAGSKACDPAPTIRRTGWRPRYPDAASGLRASLGSGATASQQAK